MFTYEKELLELQDRKERLIREAKVQRLLRQAKQEPERVRRGWLKLLSDITFGLFL